MFNQFLGRMLLGSEEYLAATDDLERGEKFVKIIPVFWVWNDDLSKDQLLAIIVGKLDPTG